jgi:hypothetical protein
MRRKLYVGNLAFDVKDRGLAEAIPAGNGALTGARGPSKGAPRCHAVTRPPPCVRTTNEGT